MKSNDKKNFIWNTIGFSGYVLVSFLLFIVVKLINGIDIAGVFAYSFSLCTLFFYLCSFYNRTYQVSDSNYKFKDYFTVRLIMSILSLVIIILFSIINSFDNFKIITIILIMVFRIIDSISDSFYGEFQKKDHLYVVGISYILKSFLGIIGFTLCDYLTNDLLLSLLILDIISFLIFCFYDIPMMEKAKSEIRISIKNVKTILISSLPVFLFSFLAIYLMNAQKYIIVYYASNEIQTIFSILIMPATVLSLVSNYLIQPYLTKFVKYKSNNDYNSFMKLYIRIISYLLFFGVIIIALSAYIGIPILNIIYRINLNDYVLDLLLIIISSLFIAVSVIISIILTVLEENRKQVLVYFVVSIISSVLCILFMKLGVIRGATLSYLISSILLMFFFSAILDFVIKKINDLNC